MDKICLIEGCGKPVLPGRKTCSPLHRDLWRKLSTGARMDGPLRVCTICGTEFTPHGPQTECSQEHRRLAARARRADLASRQRERA